jgi:hypothetical protein
MGAKPRASGTIPREEWHAQSRISQISGKNVRRLRDISEDFAISNQKNSI